VNDESSQASAETLSEQPSVTFETLTFSDGTKIALDPDDIVVFVGPNNAGKSAALRELEAHFAPNQALTVITSATLRTTGTTDDLLRFLDKHASKRGDANDPRYTGFRYAFGASKAAARWPGNIDIFRPLFCMRVGTETRITDSNAVAAIATLTDTPSHPIHLLFRSSELERKISAYFKRAFNKDLIVFRAGGSEWPLLVGERQELKPGEDVHSEKYQERVLASSSPLAAQGDGMRSFASVILQLLAPNTPSVLLLDEPEAYLHPPQARLLGEFIAKEKPKGAQLFIATHSADVLQGLLNIASTNLRIVRLQREGSINRVRELDKTRTKEIGGDPLMKFSNVLSGIFYQRVIIGESDSDCMFYSAVLDLQDVHGPLQPDVLFVHAGGKHRLAALAEALRALDVDVDVIVDMDVIKDEAVLQRLVLALGGTWPDVKAQADPLRTAIESQKPTLSASEVTAEISKILTKTPSTGAFPKILRDEINAVFRKSTPWEAIKAAGEAIIPSGTPRGHYDELQRLCNNFGLWIVPVGEVEGFCRSVGGHGPRWVQEVISTKALDADQELLPARIFVQKIWARRSAP
jgi:hypothetical protein